MGEETIYRVKNDSQDMLEAGQKARQSFKYFWRELTWENRRIIPSLDLAVVKFPFETARKPNTPAYEHMWIDDISFDGETISGTLVNQPRWVKHLEAGALVSVPLAEISDWMFAHDGKVYGGYSVNLMRSKMEPAQRQQHDEAWGFDFGDPDLIEITPYTDENLKASCVTSSEDSKLGSQLDLELPEHPMSINMAQEFEALLNESPDILGEKDFEGWTLLHREVLAGNVLLVESLLKNGANPYEQNDKGENAFDLAQKMGWTKIQAALLAYKRS
ncbi:hypothetical protein COW36_15985 [bacterium (Candidatus Blackallbacteria) CG17_big_fil_post_rev_8_21_14_2_50_48_46]|uniref:DUF2314 domain-containing protein n=1 Tax=bacterium (Candidatus Blackallbacteria) CG17_big_fil_post_rev_8_21_14_2_50_48_46 TaxID=2014261 RepID=A0A2M7G1X2_9BACT|nr:MAG: hypothetical protein COW64_09135 [bacterium (Candidatus Blackallbacteria) CG18_big_fil_WC_8_21_14_2_50_49_26]PIW15768.1 MAG: hypothetical protein COW36_15985 [bacterium (Candidatus Blackallbacteria) CG17_big_fil_post_rev_8_21_14_2_50_48_46]PIW48734.1 MAG: hypothetical protein COW20_08270 [bacterium (Candidatus Blackallbacteria) CG13_big_fil_rev_8_21_14_2_50_49_14]